MRSAPSPARYLGTQLGLEPSISQVAKRFIGTGRPRAPVPPGKLRRLRSAAAAMAVPAALARAHRAGPPPPRPARGGRVTGRGRGRGREGRWAGLTWRGWNGAVLLGGVVTRSMMGVAMRRGRVCSKGARPKGGVGGWL